MVNGKIKPFCDLYPVSTAVLNIARSRGIAWVLVNKRYRKYNPCLIASVYYTVREIKYIEPEIASFNEEGRLILADFGDFSIYYDELEDRYYVDIKDTSKYGKGFEKYLRLIVNVRNEDGICRTLVTAISNFESGEGELTEDGISALYTVAALMTESIRAVRPELPTEAAELIRRLREVPKEVPEKVPEEVVNMPEIDEIVRLIKKASDRYGLSVDSIMRIVKRRLES